LAYLADFTEIYQLNISSLSSSMVLPSILGPMAYQNSFLQSPGLPLPNLEQIYAIPPNTILPPSSRFSLRDFLLLNTLPLLFSVCPVYS
jgi:hypothetical protein